MKREVILDVYQNRVYLLSECDSEMIKNFPTRYIPVNVSENIANILVSHPEPQPQETYKKAYIKLESDLPKENGTYFCHDRGNDIVKWFDKSQIPYWIEVDWYLQPLPARTEQENNIAKTETDTGKLVDMPDRIYFTDNMDFLAILTKWCFAHSVSFSGKESSVITSAVNEYVNKKSLQEKQTAEEILKEYGHWDYEGNNECILEVMEEYASQSHPMTTDEEIEEHFKTSHYDNKNGHHYRINKDRILGAKWMRDKLNNKEK